MRRATSLALLALAVAAVGLSLAALRADLRDPGEVDIDGGDAVVEATAGVPTEVVLAVVNRTRSDARVAGLNEC